MPFLFNSPNFGRILSWESPKVKNLAMHLNWCAIGHRIYSMINTPAVIFPKVRHLREPGHKALSGDLDHSLLTPDALR